ncbi:MAG TPA: outer membrane beta-barrel protein [Vicinamibacterales bacterium]|nr:outer membrane beta-barrel protein [Vicinamibacterales bacterium]
MNRGASSFACAVFFISGLAAARPAEAQWYFVGYLGANVTKAATVSVDVPASGLSLEFSKVKFAAHPFESPQYYGWRLGKLFHGRFGLEGEFIHLKMYARTDAVYLFSGTSGVVPFAIGQPMRTVVQRYAMSHGLNFLLLNAVSRVPIGSGRAAVIVRAGAGSTVAHTETTVLNSAVDKYERAGFGVHAAAGLSLALGSRVSLVTEYKFTRARPEISVAGGTGRTTAATHQFAFGLAFGLGR